MLFSRAAGRVALSTSTKPPLLQNTLRDRGRQVFRARCYATEAAADVPRAEIPQPRSRLRRAIGFTSLATFAFVIGASAVPIGIASTVTPDTIPTDAETLEVFQPPDEASQRIEDHIRTHPLAQKMRSLPNYTETRPHLKFPQEFRGRHLIAGTLLGPNRMVVPPYVFYEKSGKDLVAITYLGQEVCGHRGIVHGGMLATMLDEGLARCCLPVLPSGVAVTAKLSIDYKKPAIADRYIVLRAETIKHEGRKVWVKGRLETLPEGDEEPVVLVEAEGLFIEPRYASKLPSLFKAST